MTLWGLEKKKLSIHLHLLPTGVKRFPEEKSAGRRPVCDGFCVFEDIVPERSEVV